MHRALHRLARTARTLVEVSTHRPRLVTTYLYRHELSVVPSVEAAAACEVRTLGIDELEVLREVKPVSLERLRAKVRRGDSCYATFVDGRIAAYHWVQTSGRHRIQRAARDVTIAEGELMVYYVRVAEWARGRRINPHVQAVILREHRDAGCRRAWIYTTRTNIASQKGIERTGWTFEKRFRALRFGRNRYVALPGAYGR